MSDRNQQIIKNNLTNYKGIKKRFDIVQKTFSDNVQGDYGFVVIDDYAHHPTEIKATIKSVNIYKKFKWQNYWIR